MRCAGECAVVRMNRDAVAQWKEAAQGMPKSKVCYSSTGKLTLWKWRNADVGGSCITSTRKHPTSRQIKALTMYSIFVRGPFCGSLLLDCSTNGAENQRIRVGFSMRVSAFWFRSAGRRLRRPDQLISRYPRQDQLMRLSTICHPPFHPCSVRSPGVSRSGYAISPSPRFSIACGPDRLR